jgi:hypothetical protein
MLVCKYCDNQFGISGSIDKKGTKKMIGRWSMLGTWTFGTIGRGWILKRALFGMLDHIGSTWGGTIPLQEQGSSQLWWTSTLKMHPQTPTMT